MGCPAVLSGCAPLLGPRTTWAGEEQKIPVRSGLVPAGHLVTAKRENILRSRRQFESPNTNIFRKNPPEQGSLDESEGIQSCPGRCWKRGQGCVLRHGGPQCLNLPFPFFLTASWGLSEMCSPVHLGLPPPPPAYPPQCNMDSETE